MKGWSEAIQSGALEGSSIRSFRSTMRLRWFRPDRTTTQPDRLQQAFQDTETGELEWRDVPVEIGAALPPAGGR